MSKLEELILRLIVRSSVTDSGYGKLRILDPVVFSAAFAKSATVSTNNSRVSLGTTLKSEKDGFDTGKKPRDNVTYKVGVHTIKS